MRLSTTPWAKIKDAEPVELEFDDLEARYPAESTSATTADYRPIKLSLREPPKSERSRRILKAMGIDNERDPRDCLSIRLVYQKKHNKGTVPEGEEWRGLKRIKLTDIGEGEEIQIDLSSAQTAQLAEHLQNLYALATQGITAGVTEKVVVTSDDAALLDELRPLMEGSTEQRDAVLRLIDDVAPGAVELAALKAAHDKQEQALLTFESELHRQDWDEAAWEAFFRRNQWIFGQGLAYQFLTEIQEQAHYGGSDISGKGGQRGDHLMSTVAARRFTVLVDVKTPQAVLVNAKSYRSGVHRVGEDVSGGVSQLQVNCRMWETTGSSSKGNRGIDALTVQPKGILIVGDTGSLTNEDMEISFELFRRGLQNPEILTFDELYERARFFVEHESEAKE